MLGFSILMVGMQTMSGAVSPLKESEEFVHVLTMFSNPIAGIIVGSFAECICVSRYFAGVISYRSYQLCNSTSNHDGNWCRGSLSGIVIIDWNE